MWEFAPKGDEVPGEWKKMRNKEYHDLYLLNPGCLHPVARVISYDIGF
jgi:hypothetical protein